MSRGGARGRSGPPPDPNALRRELDKGDWTQLPALGRQGPTPAWPLTRPSGRELALWAEEWRRPQAVMWQVNRQEIEVALYVRSLREAEMPRARVTLRTLVKQQQEALGISVSGMARNRWIIASETPERPRVVAGQSTKDRLRG